MKQQITTLTTNIIQKWRKSAAVCTFFGSNEINPSYRLLLYVLKCVVQFTSENTLICCVGTTHSIAANVFWDAEINLCWQQSSNEHRHLRMILIPWHSGNPRVVPFKSRRQLLFMIYFILGIKECKKTKSHTTSLTSQNKLQLSTIITTNTTTNDNITQYIKYMFKKDVITNLAVDKQRLYSRYSVPSSSWTAAAATTAYKPPSLIPS
jgi:hypothetical protein